MIKLSKEKVLLYISLSQKKRAEVSVSEMLVC